jgi:peptidyl-prolyl cis-trans isomerase A (cyclophilin A)
MVMRSVAAATLTLGVIFAAFAPAQDKTRSSPQPADRPPAVFKAGFDTSKGAIVIEVHRDWSPHGADRFYELVRSGFYNGCRFFRVIDKTLAEFGVNGDPGVQRTWAGATIPDDPVRQMNKRGFVTFQKSSDEANSRSTRVFINLADNSHFDLSFPAFGRIVAGVDVADSLYSAYAGGPQRNFARILAEGNAFLDRSFPKLDYIKTAVIVP